MAELPELEMFDEQAGMSATKVFVGGLPQHTTNASLVDAFILFEPAMCEVMMDRVTGRSRGFGFVHFSDADNAQTLLLSGPHIVDGKEVSVSPCWEKGAVPRASSTPRPSSTGSISSSQLKVFVGGISQHSTVESLNAYFSQFGSADAYIMMDKSTGRSRGFAFVNFMDEATMNAVLQTPHEVDGVPVTVSEYRDTNPKGKGKGKSSMGEASIAHPAAAPRPAHAAHAAHAVPTAAGQDINSTLGHALNSVQALIASLTGQQAPQPQAAAAAPSAAAMVRSASGKGINRASDRFKIWVGGLSQATTRESLNNYFSQFGYADSYVMMDKATGRSRGFGFVTFAEEQVMETVLGFQHEIDGVLVTCSPYQSSGPPPSPHAALPAASAGPSAATTPTNAAGAVNVAEALLSNLQTLLTEKISSIATQGADSGMGASEVVDDEESPVKVFVGGLSQSTTGDLLQATFAPYSPLQCEVMLDKITGRSRGFGFVTVGSHQMAQLMISTAHVIDGKQVEVSECWAKGAKPSSSKGAGKSHRSSPY